MKDRRHRTPIAFTRDSFPVAAFSARPDDDVLLELAFASACRYIVTHNVNDFRGSEQLGVLATSPRDFLNEMRTKV